jgi:transcriptional regulator with XRE-family HTH domain
MWSMETKRGMKMQGDPPFDLVEFGNYVRRLRVENGLTQQDIYMRTGVPTNTVNRIEKAKSWPILYTLAQVADGMGFDLEVKFVKRG